MTSVVLEPKHAMEMPYIVVPLKEIKCDKSWNPRSNYDGLDELGQDIKKRGLIAPVVIWPRPTGKPQYQLIVGFRRYLAAQMAGMETIQAQVFPGSEVEAMLLNLRENVLRKDLTTYELAVQCRKLKDEKNMSGADVAQSIGKDRVYINALVKCLNALHPTIIKAWSDSHHPQHALCSINTIQSLAATEHESQLAQWDVLTAKVVPADARESGGKRRSKSDTEKASRPTVLRVSEAIQAIKESELDEDSKRAMMVALRWSIGLSQDGRNATKVLRLGKVDLYDSAQKLQKELL